MKVSFAYKYVSFSDYGISWARAGEDAAFERALGGRGAKVSGLPLYVCMDLYISVPLCMLYVCMLFVCILLYVGTSICLSLYVWCLYV